MNRARGLSMLLVSLLWGCGSLPQTPAEHREAAKSGRTFFRSDSFEVKRPLAEVARTFQKKAPECLSFSMATTTRPNIGFGSTTNVWGKTKQTVLASANRAELHFQAKIKGQVGEEPEDGVYYMVADAYPVGKDRTRVDMYWITRVDLLAQAIRGWASGENLGCPDPTKLFPG
ncbi:MAG TPA: hypothetical protein VK143_11890 [Burkholderiales bacterium]|nr:hypothetical protein [Burkholderiales bacterium]